MKNYLYCQNNSIHKHGKKNTIQRYKCNHCNKVFAFQKN
ncbi:IS1/IS1595 family N-terminal zinc-binding domain-containing protein [Volucribacter psittacicida]